MWHCRVVLVHCRQRLTLIRDVTKVADEQSASRVREFNVKVSRNVTVVCSVPVNVISC